MMLKLTELTEQLRKSASSIHAKGTQNSTYFSDFIFNRHRAYIIKVGVDHFISTLSEKNEYISNGKKVISFPGQNLCWTHFPQQH